MTAEVIDFFQWKKARKLKKPVAVLMPAKRESQNVSALMGERKTEPPERLPQPDGCCD